MLGAPGYTRAADSTLTPTWTISYGYEKFRAEKRAYPPTEGKPSALGLLWAQEEGRAECLPALLPTISATLY